MAQRVGESEAKAGQASTAQTQNVSTAPLAPSLDDQIRNEMTNILSSLLLKAQELGFELATLEDPYILNHPVVKKARELIVELKKLFEVQKKLRT